MIQIFSFQMYEGGSLGPPFWIGLKRKFYAKIGLFDMKKYRNFVRLLPSTSMKFSPLLSLFLRRPRTLISYCMSQKNLSSRNHRLKALTSKIKNFTVVFRKIELKWHKRFSQIFEKLRLIHPKIRKNSLITMGFTYKNIKIKFYIC